MPIDRTTVRTTFPGVFDAVPDGALDGAIAAAYLQLSAAEWGDRLDLAATYMAADLASVVAGGQALGAGGVGAGAVGATSFAAGPVSMTLGGGGAGAGAGGGGAGAGSGSVYGRLYDSLRARTIVPVLGW